MLGLVLVLWLIYCFAKRRQPGWWRAISPPSTSTSLSDDPPISVEVQQPHHTDDKDTAKKESKLPKALLLTPLSVNEQWTVRDEEVVDDDAAIHV